MHSTVFLIVRVMGIKFSFKLTAFNLLKEIAAINHETDLQLNENEFNISGMRDGYGSFTTNDNSNIHSKNHNSISNKKGFKLGSPSNFDNKKPNGFKKYLQTHSSIKLIDLNVDSSVEYLNDDGKITKHISNPFHYDEIHVFKDPGYDFDGSFYRSDLEGKKLPELKNRMAEDEVLTEAISNNFNNINNHNKSIHEKEDNNKEKLNEIPEENNETPQKKFYTTSFFNYYLLKFLSLFGYESGILHYNHTEFEYISFFLQLFFHIPLFLTALVIFVIILTFDPDMNLEMIREEINNLPESKYTEEMTIKECPICLEHFEIAEDI
ncbi:hypothetical protein NUSPORA_01642 [Nucleospora cyclopteri]